MEVSGDQHGQIVRRLAKSCHRGANRGHERPDSTLACLVAFGSQSPGSYIHLCWLKKYSIAMQGQTLERVKVDLGRTFEKGQYVVSFCLRACS